MYATLVVVAYVLRLLWAFCLSYIRLLCSLLARFTPWEFTRFGIGDLLSVRKGLYTDR